MKSIFRFILVSGAAPWISAVAWAAAAGIPNLPARPVNPAPPAPGPVDQHQGDQQSQGGQEGQDQSQQTQQGYMFDAIQSEQVTYLDASQLNSVFDKFTVTHRGESGDTELTVQMRGMVYNECMGHFRISNTKSGNLFARADQSFGGKSMPGKLGFAVSDSYGASHDGTQETGAQCQARLRKLGPCSPSGKNQCSPLSNHPAARLALNSRDPDGKVQLFTPSFDTDSDDIPSQNFVVSGEELELVHANQRTVDQQYANQEKAAKQSAIDQQKAIYQDCRGSTEDLRKAQRALMFLRQAGIYRDESYQSQLDDARYQAILRDISTKRLDELDTASLIEEILSFGERNPRRADEAADLIIKLAQRKVSLDPNNPANYTAAVDILHRLLPDESKDFAILPISATKLALLRGEFVNLRAGIASAACAGGQDETCTDKLDRWVNGKGKKDPLSLLNRYKACQQKGRCTDAERAAVNAEYSKKLPEVLRESYEASRTDCLESTANQMAQTGMQVNQQAVAAACPPALAQGQAPSAGFGGGIGGGLNAGFNPAMGNAGFGGGIAAGIGLSGGLGGGLFGGAQGAPCMSCGGGYRTPYMTPAYATAQYPSIYASLGAAGGLGGMPWYYNTGASLNGAVWAPNYGSYNFSGSGSYRYSGSSVGLGGYGVNLGMSGGMPMPGMNGMGAMGGMPQMPRIGGNNVF